MQQNVEIRELSDTEIENISGAVHLGGLASRIAQYLWSRSLN
jgi:hypothetical protein